MQRPTKVFYKSVNRKLKNRDEVQRITVDDVTYDDVKEIVEVMNNSFQKVFTEESEFEGITLRTEDGNG